MTQTKVAWTVKHSLDPLGENVLAHSVAKDATRNGRSAARSAKR